MPKHVQLQEKLVEKIQSLRVVDPSAKNSFSFFGGQTDEDDVEVMGDDRAIRSLSESNDDLEKKKVEIPQEFLDEITQELMTIPMTLPSGKTVDKTTVERCEEGQAMWGGQPRDPFTGRLFTDTVKPVFSAGLKSRIDRFIVENRDISEVNSVGRTLGSARKIAQFLDEKHRGVKRRHGEDISGGEEKRCF